MDTSTSTLMTGLIVTGGQVSQGKGVDLKVVLSVLFLAIMLSVIGDSNAKFAQRFGLLILVGAVFAYAPSIIKGVGLNSKGAK